MPNRRPVKAVYVVRFAEQYRAHAMENLEYPVIIEPLPQNEGGGFVVLVPDLLGCMSDGETCEEALAWLEEARVGQPVPLPSRHLQVAE